MREQRANAIADIADQKLELALSVEAMAMYAKYLAVVYALVAYCQKVHTHARSLLFVCASFVWWHVFVVCVSSSCVRRSHGLYAKHVAVVSYWVVVCFFCVVTLFFCFLCQCVYAHCLHSNCSRARTGGENQKVDAKRVSAANN